METSDILDTTRYCNQIKAAKYLGLSKSMISLMTSKKEISHYRIGRSVRYLKDDLDKFMENHKIYVSYEELGRKAR